MKDSNSSNQKDQKKINLKFKKMIFSDISMDKYNKNSINEKLKKNIKKKREKEKIKKEKNEKLKNQIYENNISIDEKSIQSKNSFINNIYKNEKFLVNKEIKLQKTYEKNDSSKTKLKKALKKKII